MSAPPPEPSPEPTVPRTPEPTAPRTPEPTAPRTPEPTAPRTPEPTAPQASEPATLGAQLESLRARRPAVIRATPPPTDNDRSIGRALGAGLGLLATFVAAIAFAFVTSRLVGGMYVTFAMPIFVGTLLASVASIGPRRFRFADRRPLVLMMIAGALVCWLGQHLLAYARVCELVGAQAGGLVPGGDLADRGLALIEKATGEAGLSAYLTYVSSGPGASLSPIGYLGRLEPGVVLTVLVALVELALMAATGAWSILYRTRQLRRITGPIAFFDAAAAARAGGALQGKRFDELAAILVGSTGLASHALAIEEGEAAAEATIWELDAAGQLGTRTSSRLLPIEGAKALRDAVERARSAAPAKGGDDAARYD